MSVAETEVGEFDAWFADIEFSTMGLNDFLGYDNFLNYTQAAEVTNQNISPRK